MKVFKEAEKATAAGESVESVVRAIIETVKAGGDQALADYSRKFDGASPQNIRVSPEEVKAAWAQVDRETIDSLQFAAGRIRNFAERQLASLSELRYEISPGVVLGHRLLPIASCGCYVPAGRYPLPSSALMSAIPAKVAGVERVAACSPPSQGRGGIHPAVLVAMDMAGVDEIYCMGGSQAIAAFACGTQTIKAVDIIVGPGNQYVTEAKRQVSGLVGIDMLAGPSEAVIIADESVNPRWIAVDALSRCEHDPNSWSVLLLSSWKLAQEVSALIDQELTALKTAELAAQSWRHNCRIIVVDSMDEAVEISDEIAPEHLQVMCADSPGLAGRLRNFGSLFIGPYAPVPFGDYVSGPNHILPTSRCARFSNGVNATTFIRICSFQEISAEGGRFLSPHCASLAGLEGLYAHQLSARLRGPSGQENGD